MRASGSSTVEGEATWIGFAERSRQAHTGSFGNALQQMWAACRPKCSAFASAHRRTRRSSWNFSRAISRALARVDTFNGVPLLIEGLPPTSSSQ